MMGKLTADELEAVHSDWLAKFNAGELLDNSGADISLSCSPAFHGLVDMVLTTPKDTISAAGTALAILQIGVAVGRAQATKDLLTEEKK
jgi:hypothetical protein